MQGQLVWLLSFIYSLAIMGVSRHYAKYHYRKAVDITYHSKTHGGIRRFIFSPEELPTVRSFLWKSILLLGDYTSLSLLSDIASYTFSRGVSTEVLSRLMTSFRWSWRIPSRVQIMKYTPTNLQRYYQFVLWIQEQDWRTIKFADESHVVSKDLRSKKVLGMINQRTWVSNNTLQYKALSVTLLTKFGDPVEPVVISMREQSNTQWDFLQFVVNCVADGHLVRGDTLVVDNACVHTGADMFDSVLSLLHGNGIQLKFLPAYSPELNPCEFCFNLMKRALRGMHGNLPLWMEIVRAVARITPENIRKEYYHALAWKNIEKQCMHQINRT